MTDIRPLLSFAPIVLSLSHVEPWCVPGSSGQALCYGMGSSRRRRRPSGFRRSNTAPYRLSYCATLPRRCLTCPVALPGCAWPVDVTREGDDHASTGATRCGNSSRSSKPQSKRNSSSHRDGTPRGQRRSHRPAKVHRPHGLIGTGAFSRCGNRGSRRRRSPTSSGVRSTSCETSYRRFGVNRGRPSGRHVADRTYRDHDDRLRGDANSRRPGEQDRYRQRVGERKRTAFGSLRERLASRYSMTRNAVSGCSRRRRGARCADAAAARRPAPRSQRSRNCGSVARFAGSTSIATVRSNRVSSAS